MNFLAHLVLAPDSAEGMVGALAPDLIRGPLPRDLRPGVLDAAREHQLIDRVTDAHRAFFTVRDRLRPALGRYAGIAADVLFDHALASHWELYRPVANEDLPGYARRVGGILTAHRHLMPERMQYATAMMVEQDWLSGYATIAGIRLTLERMSRRFSERLNRVVELTPAADLIMGDSAWLHAAFGTLWPDLRSAVARSRLALTHARKQTTR